MSYIDREKLLNSLDKYDFPSDKCYEITFETIDGAPTEDVAPIKHGKWEVKEFVGDFNNCAYCSNCGEFIETREYEPKYVTRENPYCKNCGAKMDLESGEGR